MSEQSLEITGDLLKALGDILGSRPERPGAVVVLAAYLDSLARGYGLSTSSEDSSAERARPPAAALELVRQHLDGASDPIDEVALGNLLYNTFVRLSTDPRACKLLNKSKPLLPAELLMAGQIYWNLERNVGDRPRLPCLAAGETAIKVPGLAWDFATMAWASRMNNGPDGVRGNTGRTKGARMAVLAAEYLIECNRQIQTPAVDAEFQQEAFRNGSRWRIVWREERPDSSLSDPIVTSRARAYYAIDSFEQGLRECIESFLLDHLQAQQVFGADYGQLCATRAQADLSETDALTHYLYPQQAYDVLLRHAGDLPDDLTHQLRRNRDEFYDFVAVRNRVMRGRPLRLDDLDRVESFVVRFRRPHFTQNEIALGRLIADRGLQPPARPGSKPPERILHNLPNPDFDETGLLGREREISEIADLVKRRREPITLTGAGGAGKTALALEVCYGLADEPRPPFDAILWTSLKTERLTAAGVRALANPIRDIASAANALGRAFDSEFAGSIRELADALGETRTLIVLDNLETVSGSEFLRLYDALPNTVAFLLTSRVGIGELERRVTVDPLRGDSAEQLFRRFARSRGQHELANRPAAWIGDVLQKLAYSPLGIRWHILRVEAGASPTDILNDQTEYLEFCVADVVRALTSDERSLLDILRSIDRPVSFGDLANLSELGVDHLRRSAQRLQQCSLADWSQSGGEDEPELLAISSTARAYLRTLAIPVGAEDVVRREAEYSQRWALERERRAEHGRYLDPNVIFLRSPGDEPTALLLQQALRESKAGDTQAAHATIERARALNPGFFEVDRVEAFMSGVRHDTDKAMTLYRSAFGGCVTEEERAWVGYFYGGLLARQTTDLAGAIRLSEKAHELFHCYDSALQLGNFYVWDHCFEEGARLIELAMELAPNKPRFERQTTAWLVACFRRWSQADLEAQLPAVALEHALHGIQLGVALLDATPQDVTDVALMDAVLEAVVAVVAAAREVPLIDLEDRGKVANALDHVTDDPRYRDRPSWRYLERGVSGLSVEMRSQLAPRFAAVHVAPGESSGTRVVGSVAAVGDAFGFIASADFPTNIYFNAWLLRAPLRMQDLKIGSFVEFAPSRNSRGQAQAQDVTLVEGDTEIARLSAAVVQHALDESPAPIALDKVAAMVRRAAGSAGVLPWIGRSFKEYLRSLQIPGLQLSVEGPGYAYIEGVHEPPTPAANRTLVLADANSAAAPLVADCALDERPAPNGLANPVE